MPRGRKKTNPTQRNYFNYSPVLKITESYLSLFLGILVVLVATIFVFIFAKNRNYEKINTAVSTHQEEITPSTTSKPKDYEVKTGDNLWVIAEKVYGSGYNWVDLAKANNLKNPNIIFSGNKFIIPDVPKIVVQNQIQNNSPNLVSISGDSYTIVKGDNLWTISIRAYGDGFKWPQIAKVNNLKNPSLIHSGNLLKIPR